MTHLHGQKKKRNGETRYNQIKIFKTSVQKRIQRLALGGGGGVRFFFVFPPFSTFFSKF